MQKEICLKCLNCHKIMRFDFYAKKFICYKCNIRKSLKEIDKYDIVILEDSDFESLIKSPKVLSINFSKEDFLKEIKRNLNFKVLIPHNFSKVLKYKQEDINLIYIPLILYNCKCFINDNYYEIKDMLFDEFNDFDKSILNTIYPLDIDESSFDLKNHVKTKLNTNYKDMMNYIHDKAREGIESINNFNDDVIFINEKIECILLPIYDCKLNYKNKEYHLLMNANTSKVSIKVPLEKEKLIIVVSILLFLDLSMFIIEHIIQITEEFYIGIGIFLFIIQILLIIIIYLSSKTFDNTEINKNKYSIKEIK